MVQLDDPKGEPAGSPAPAPVAAAVDALAFTSSTVIADAVRFERAGRVILDDVSLTARPGEVIAVTGPSGSGKSSLLALLAGLERPGSGEVRIEPAAERRGIVLQSYGLASLLTAAENVEIALQSGAAGRMRRSEVRARAAAAIDSVGLSEVADHLVEELSGGQQQRVAVARALSIQPSVLFADEVSAELDHTSKERVLELVFELAARGGTVVLATHDQEIAGRCTRELRLVDGRAAP